MISADPGKPLALGRTADIYQWENGRLLKLFHDWFDLDDILFEQKWRSKSTHPVCRCLQSVKS